MTGLFFVGYEARYGYSSMARSAYAHSTGGFAPGYNSNTNAYDFGHAYGAGGTDGQTYGYNYEQSAAGHQYGQLPYQVPHFEPSIPPPGYGQYQLPYGSVLVSEAI